MLVMPRPWELLRDAHRFSKAYAQHEGAVNLIRAIPRKIAALRGVGEIPRIEEPFGRPSRPISFIVTWCTDELRYNLLASTCVGDPANQLVVVDDRDQLAFRVRAAAINAGVRAAIHDLLVIVHEDVYLPDGWHPRLEARLAELEQFDPAWAVVGVSGWDESGKIVGHSRHLNVSLDSFRSGCRWIRASGLDDHVVIVRRCEGFSADESSPGHRGHATDLVQSANRASRFSYVLDVPTVHRWRDATGRLIRRALDSPKAQDEFYSAYRAERAMGQEFLDLKWPARPGTSLDVESGAPRRDRGRPGARIPERIRRRLDSPVILLARGGGGSRLLSLLARDCGVFLGNDLNGSGDCMELALPIFKSLFRKYRSLCPPQQGLSVPDLRAAAALMLTRARLADGRPWGFKVPESLLLLPELGLAFPDARYVFSFRHPLATCLRRPHQSALLDNPIGRLTLPLAYDHAGRDRACIRVDSDPERMALTTVHQLETALRRRRERLSPCRCHELRFEDLLLAPEQEMNRLGDWLQTSERGKRTLRAIDLERALGVPAKFPDPVVSRVRQILAPLFGLLPYEPDVDPYAPMLESSLWRSGAP